MMSRCHGGGMDKYVVVSGARGEAKAGFHKYICWTFLLTRSKVEIREIRMCRRTMQTISRYSSKRLVSRCYRGGWISMLIQCGKCDQSRPKRTICVCITGAIRHATEPKAYKQKESRPHILRKKALMLNHTREAKAGFHLRCTLMMTVR